MPPLVKTCEGLADRAVRRAAESTNSSAGRAAKGMIKISPVPLQALSKWSPEAGL